MGHEAAPARAEFERALTWRDGLVLTFSIPMGTFALIGYSVGVLGAWTAMTLWGVAALIGLLQNVLFAEMAAMFPDKPGGIALYAHEAWRRYCSPIGALAAGGYWAGWSFSLAIFAMAIGGLLQAQFFAGSTWTVSNGVVDIGLSHCIAVAAIVAVWALNVRGIRPAVWVNRVVGVIAAICIGALLVGPFVTGKFDAGNLRWGLGEAGQAWNGWQLATVYLFVMCWSAYATEIAATFSPEYRNQRRDAIRALLASALIMIVVAMLGSIAPVGVVGPQAVVDDPVGYIVAAFDQTFGGGSAVMTLALCAALFTNMTSSTADAGRALYGVAKDGMIIRQLHHLSPHGMPARAMTLDLAVNIVLVLFVGNILGVLFASNVGYMTAVFFAVTGFLLLRRDRPAWPRPIRLGAVWVPVAMVLAAVNLVLIVVGSTHPALAGYGGATEQLIGFGILGASLVLFVIRRVVQDRGGLRLREPTPRTLEEARAMDEASAAAARGAWTRPAEGSVDTGVRA